MPNVNNIVNVRFTGSTKGLTKALIKSQLALRAMDKTVDLLAGGLKKTFLSIDNFNSLLASQAGILTSISKTNVGESLDSQFRRSFHTVSSMNDLFISINKNTLATFDQMAIVNRELLKTGVIIDRNNKKQVQGFESFVNAISIFTAGMPDATNQFRQEANAVLNGVAGKGRDVANFLKSVFGDTWKDQIKQMRENGTLLERFGEIFKGFRGNIRELTNTWKVQGSTLQTYVDDILRRGFEMSYKRIIALVKTMNKLLEKNRDEYVSRLNVLFEKVAKNIGKMVNFLLNNGTTAIVTFVTFAEKGVNAFISLVKLASKMLTYIDSIGIRLQMINRGGGLLGSLFGKGSASKDLLKRADSEFLKTVERLNAKQKLILKDQAGLKKGASFLTKALFGIEMDFGKAGLTKHAIKESQDTMVKALVKREEMLRRAQELMELEKKLEANKSKLNALSGIAGVSFDKGSLKANLDETLAAVRGFASSFRQEFAEIKKEMSVIWEPLEDAEVKTKDWMTKLVEDFKVIAELWNAFVDNISEVSLRKVKETTELMTEFWGSMMDAIESDISSWLVTWTDGIAKGEEVWHGFLQSVSDSFQKLIADMVAKMIMSGFLKLFMMTFGGPAGLFVPGPGPANTLDLFEGSPSGGFDLASSVDTGSTLVSSNASQELSQGRTALISASNDIRAMGNDMSRLTASMERVSSRPIQNVIDFGETQMLQLSRDMNKTDYRRREMLV